MPSHLPSSRDAHINAALTDFSIGYGQELAGQFVAMRGSTMKRVQKQSDYYYIWNKGDFFRSEYQKRAPGDVSKSAGQRLSNTTYFADVYALSTYLPMQTRENADLNLEQPKIRYLSHQGMLRRDKLFADNCFGAGLWTSNTEQTGIAAGIPGANQFLRFDESGSTPITVIQDQLEVVRKSIGMVPNKMFLGADVNRVLRRHPDLTELFKYTSGGLPSDSDIAGVFGLGQPNPEIIVGRTIENTAAEGLTPTMVDVYQKSILLAWVSPDATTDMPTAITGFSWSPFDQVTADAVAIDSWWDQDRKAWKYEGEIAVDFKITANDAGVFLLDAIS